MIGVSTLAPSRLTLVSISTMSRSTRGRSLSFRHAATFSLAVISSSAPVSQNTHDSGRITRCAFCSSASRSTQSLSMNSLFPPLARRAITPLHVCITEMRCPGARRRGRLGVSSIAGSVPCRPPVRPPPTSARPSASCTSPAASSFPIRGMSAARAICKASASRRWRRPAPATPIREGYPDGAQSHGRGAGALSRARRGDRHSAQRRFRERLRRRSRQGRGKRDALHRHRRRRPVDRGLRRRTRRRSTNSTPRWRASRRRAPRSTRPAATSCSPRAPRASSAAGPTSTRPSGGSRPSPTPAPIASTRPASRPASISRPP